MRHRRIKTASRRRQAGTNTRFCGTSGAVHARYASRAASSAIAVRSAMPVGISASD